VDVPLLQAGQWQLQRAHRFPLHNRTQARPAPHQLLRIRLRRQLLLHRSSNLRVRVYLVRWLAPLRKSSLSSSSPLKTVESPPAGTEFFFHSGVAVGSSIGHAIGGFFSGGSSSAPQETTQQAVANGDAQAAYSSNYNPPRVCENQVFQFRSCMDQNQGDLNVCGWYLDQLKACQQAASQYGSQ
jgi:hypothetical protein